MKKFHTIDLILTFLSNSLNSISAMRKLLQFHCLYLKAPAFYPLISLQPDHSNKTSLLQTAIRLSLFSCFFYSSTAFSSDCYKQFADSKRLILTIPQNGVKKNPAKIQSKIQRFKIVDIKLNPPKYAEKLNLPKNSKERENFIQTVQNALPAGELIVEFEYKRHKGFIERSIKSYIIQQNQPLKNQRHPVSKFKKSAKSAKKAGASQTKKLTEDQILKLAEQIEAKALSLQERITEELQNQPPQKITERLQKKNQELEEIQEKISEFSSSPIVWQKYNRQIKNIEEELSAIDIYKSINSLQELVEHPSFLFPDYSYSAHLKSFTRLENQIYDIQFSEPVVKALDKLKRKQKIHIFKKIQKGFVGGKKETGLRILTQNFSSKSRLKNELVEIKTMGVTTGHIRILGYIDGNKITFEGVKTGSDHSKTTSKQNFKEKIHQISLKRK